jgi:hypothetical protein
VNKGTTVIQRKSSESSVTIPDRETTKTLVRRVEEALQGRASYTVNKVTPGEDTLYEASLYAILSSPLSLLVP